MTTNRSPFVRSRAKAAGLLDVSDRQLGNWANELWFPSDGKTAAGWNVPLIREIRDELGLKGSETSNVQCAKQGLVVDTARHEELIAMVGRLVSGAVQCVLRIPQGLVDVENEPDHTAFYMNWTEDVVFEIIDDLCDSLKALSEAHRSIRAAGRGDEP